MIAWVREVPSRGEVASAPDLPRFGQPFDFAPGTVLMEKPAVKELPDGTYQVTYRFTVVKPNPFYPPEG